MEALLQRLRAELGPLAVLTGEAVRQRPVSRLIQSGCEAGALVRPASTLEVARVLQLCHEAGQAVVPRAGMTGLVGGTLVGPSEIALSLERMNRIEEIDTESQTMTVQAGVPLQAIQEAAEAHGLLFALDLGARGSATIGGNIATNAGGNKVLRYGMTRDLVLGLEVVLANGEVISSLFKILKNNTGLDIKQLFIGTEGTLGVVTRAILRLHPGPRTRQTVLAAFPDFSSVATVLQRVRAGSGGTLSSFEIMWRDYYLLLTAPGRRPAPLSQTHPFYALIECEGSTDAADDSGFQMILQSCLEENLIADAVLAQSETERASLWRIRDDVHYLKTLNPLFVFDISLPLPAMERYVEGLRATLAERWQLPTVIAYGHLGDGNLHLAISCGDTSNRHDIEHIVYEPLKALRGSVSAEHGIGLDKKTYLEFTRTPQEIAVMRAVKRALDPSGILNPGKIL
ncbi:MAG: FAD-binding oxidoreductase [Ideonella sp.]|nr:FAD-binding oxidoreductase [Ideonella sp.]MCE7902786.1 FAD-binding oxidoreductase [Gammaproteobacteria bacterium PRO9]